MLNISIPHSLIGMSEAAAKKAVSDNDFFFQVIERDGVRVPHGRNTRLDRVNLIIEDETVMRAYIG